MSKKLRDYKANADQVIHRIALLIEAGCDITAKNKAICTICKKDYYENRVCETKMKNSRWTDETKEDMSCELWHVYQITAKTNILL